MGLKLIMKYYVYFIGPDCNERQSFCFLKHKSYYYPFKVGVSHNINKRIIELQTGNFVGLKELIKIGPYSKEEAFSTECFIHNQLRNYQSFGEWFMLTKENHTHIRDLLSNVIPPEVIDELCLFIPTQSDWMPLVNNKSRQLAREILEFKKICNIVKASNKINSRIFWKLADDKLVDVRISKKNKLYYFFEQLTREDRLVILLTTFRGMPQL